MGVKMTRIHYLSASSNETLAPTVAGNMYAILMMTLQTALQQLHSYG